MAGLVAPVTAAAFAATIGFDGVYRFSLAVAALSWACVATYARFARGRGPRPARRATGTT